MIKYPSRASSPVQPAEIPADTAFEAINMDTSNRNTATEAPLPFALLTFDGEVRQVKCIMESPVFTDGKSNIHGAKSSAACSISQQANDVMKGFSTIRKYVKSVEAKILSMCEVQQEHYVRAFRQRLVKSGMDIQSVNTFTHFMSLLHRVLSKAYSVPAIERGWNIIGLAGPKGYDIRKNMSQWPGWQNLTPDIQTKILEKIIRIANKVKKNKIPYHGEIVDSVMEKYFKKYLGKRILAIIVSVQRSDLIVFVCKIGELYLLPVI